MDRPNEDQVGIEAPSGASPQRGRIVSGDLRRALLWLALPVLGEQLLHSAVAFVDIFLAGRLDETATVAVGLAAYVQWLAAMFFALVGTGTTALVARSIGGGEAAEANRFTNQSLTLSILAGLAFSAGMWVVAPGFMHLQGLTGAAGELVTQYLRIDALAMPFISLCLVGCAALRGAGDTRTPLRILGTVNLFNVVFSTALVFGWGPWGRMGVWGILLGTVGARVLGGVLLLAVLGVGRSGLKTCLAQLRPQREASRRLLRIGGPAATDGMLMWAAQFVFLMIIARLGQGEDQLAYYAAHMIGVRLESLTYLPATAWSVAAATMIGQNLGATQPERAQQAGRLAAKQAALLACAVGAILLFGADFWYGLMHTNPLVSAVAVGPFRMVACCQPLLALSIVYVGALRGAGDTRFPMLCTAIGQLAVRLPLAYLLGVVLGWNLWGAWLAMCVDFTLRAVLLNRRFTWGRWLTVRV